MESKTKHRILGIVVVAGLAVLAYPFIQGGNTISKEQVSVNAPPFPDQAIQVTSNDDSAVIVPQDITSASANEASAPMTAPQDPAINPNQADEVINIAEPGTAAPAGATPAAPNATTVAPDATTSPSAPSTAVQPKATPDVSKQVTPDADATKPAVEATPISSSDASTSTSAMNTAAEEQSAAVVEETVSKPAKKLTSKANTTPKAPALMSKFTTAAAINANKRQPVSNNGLMQLKQAAYVVQLGSFKEKTNALRLVNKLRAQGYRAFIQHSVVASGENTRVFVGPEHHQASARVLAAELESKMKVHGIVISYKPFTL